MEEWLKPQFRLWEVGERRRLWFESGGDWGEFVTSTSLVRVAFNGYLTDEIRNIHKYLSTLTVFVLSKVLKNI